MFLYPILELNVILFDFAFFNLFAFEENSTSENVVVAKQTEVIVYKTLPDILYRAASFVADLYLLL